MKNILNKILQSVDKFYVNPHLSVFGEFSGVLCLCFHTVFEKNEDKQNKHTIPNIGLTVDEYKRIFDYFLEHKYKFISINNINNLNPESKYIHISFDDGYFNNLHILPTLKEYSIPAQIFIITNNILSSNKFWWDIVYNKRILKGVPMNDVYKEIAELQKKHFTSINSYIYDNFGKDSLKSLSDLDRPLTQKELKELSEDDLITIGNHTSDHAVLNNLTIEEAKKQIEDAQGHLKDLLGYKPDSFAFPNNSYKKEHLLMLRDLGINFGFSGDFRHNKIPNGFEGEQKMRIGRYSIYNNRDMNWQFKMLRAGFTPFIVAKEIKRYLT